MKALMEKYKLELIGFGVGAIGGLAYWYFVGCSTGTCLITSKPINSLIYGGVMGIFLFGMFRKQNQNQ